MWSVRKVVGVVEGRNFLGSMELWEGDPVAHSGGEDLPQ